MISGLQFFGVRIALALFLAVIVISSHTGGNSFQAQAAALTPEANQYQVDSDSSPYQAEQNAGKENFQNSANELFKQNKQPQAPSETTKQIGETLTKPAKSTKQKLEGAAETVKEKLNLDQPLYPGTKEVLDEAQDKVESVDKQLKR